MNKIVVIAGATGVGKTSLSIKLAKEFDGEIVNADASQFHKLLDIGTSKIKKDEMDGIKHHLIDFLEANDNSYSIFQYQKDGRKVIDEIINKHKNVFVVGGSGLYINALIYNYEMKASKSTHDDYDCYTNEELFEILKGLDSNLASLTHPNNRKRVLRYIERAKEGDFGQQELEPVYDVLFLHLYRDRDTLYERINKRCVLMLEEGWVSEVKGLIDKAYNLDEIKEIGYKEIGDYLDGKIEYNDLISLIQKETRHYAKRQETWFKNKNNCVSINMDDDGYYEYLIRVLKEFYKN